MLGTGHHLYWAGGPDLWVPLGSIFSFIEVLPLVLLILDAIRQHQTIKSQPTFKYGLAYLYIIGAAFWNFVGAGVFGGGVLNAPLVNYYEHGTFLTLNHAHTALFGAFGLVTGPLWARKAWGVYWPWDARTVTALLLWLIFVAYLLVRKYGGPGSDKLAAGLGLFGIANAPFVYKSVDWWRTIHPKTTVVRSLDQTAPEMYRTLLYCAVSFLLLFCTLLMARVQLEARRAELDRLYLELED